MRAVLHRLIVAAVGLFNRNPWTGEHLAFIRAPHTEHFHADGLLTTHQHAFLDDSDFRRAYQRAVRAAGWDYDIPWRLHTMLWAARTAARVPGAFVECGTGRGFFASGVCEALGWEERPFFLMDTFEPGWVDPVKGRTGIPSEYYASGAEAVRENFRQWPGAQLVEGEIPGTLDQVTGPVAFLHLDMNHPDPEEQALRYFWPLMSPGAVLVMDDYGYEGFEVLHERLDAVAAELGFAILSLPTGQGLAVK